MFEDITAQYGTKFLVAALAVLLGLACLALVLWMVRRRPSSPFIRGGRNRQPRLSVLDPAAVDTRRRLLLVRRDDVEHLLMIGGPTDIVIESRIVGASAANLPDQPQQAAMPEVSAAAIVLPAESAPDNCSQTFVPRRTRDDDFSGVGCEGSVSHSGCAGRGSRRKYQQPG